MIILADVFLPIYYSWYFMFSFYSHKNFFLQIRTGDPENLLSKLREPNWSLAWFWLSVFFTSFSLSELPG
jgi:hypothetical protein